jgi:tripartite-type tricarboxylate transporter receptor subunit TctC
MDTKKLHLLKKTLGKLIAVSIVLILPSCLFAGDAFPNKPLRLVIPFPPGGMTDIVGRLIADKLSERLGKQVIADNRGGAGGVIGTEMASKADPDGHTLLIIASSYAINPALGNTPYDPRKAFTPIAKVGEGPFILIANTKAPAGSVKELIALAKQKPGQLVFSNSGVGSGPHLAAELFKMKAGIDFKIVQFKGGNPALTDLMGGHSQFAFHSLIAVLPQIKAGQCKALGISGTKRSPTLPDVPTIAEAGLPGYAATQWFGIVTPAGAPAPIIDRLSKELKAIMEMDEVKKRFRAEGAEVDYSGPAEFGPFIENALIECAQVVKQANIKADDVK